MALNLPNNVKQDPNTGLYIITSPSGQTFRVNASTQSQLDSYVNSVNTNTPVNVQVTNPTTGVNETKVFNPVQIANTTNAINQNNLLLTETKRTTGIVGNTDGTYTDLRTGQTLTQAEAADAIKNAGLPPEALAAITPKSSPAYASATSQVNATVNIPSNINASPAPTSTQPPPAIEADNTRLPVADDDLPPSVDTFVENAETIPITIDEETAAGEEIENRIDNEIPQDVGDEDAFEASRLEAEERLNEQEQIENEVPADIGEEDPFEASRLEAEQALNREELLREENGGQVPQGLINDLRSDATNKDAVSFAKAKDWRVRLTLAPSAKYLYKADSPGILGPLAQTDGVIFPYTPSVSVAYNAAYESSDLVHSNYKIYNYKNSSVDNITISCDFTAQDTNEANYLLAVIHFFRSVTKMFYGRDENPRNGVPPPLCYMSGLGTFQFDNHPLVITNFTYALPTDVDYIRAGSQTNEPGNNVGQQTPPVNNDSAAYQRITSSGLGKRTPNFVRQAATINSDATYVPTKINLSISCIPVVSRNDVSNRFSLKDYATGALLQGSKQNGGGIW
jgi:hypothetical protein